MVGDDLLLADLVGELVSNALNQASRVDKNQSSAMFLNKRCNTRDGLIPDFVSGDRTQLVRGDLHLQVDLASVTGIDNGAARSPIGLDVGGAYQEACHLFDRPLGSAQSDARDWLVDQRAQAFD